MPKPFPVVVHLRRHRFLPNAGGGTCFVCVTYRGESDTLAFLHPGQFPEFEGDQAWFQALQHPRKRFELIRQVANKAGEPLPA